MLSIKNIPSVPFSLISFFIDTQNNGLMSFKGLSSYLRFFCKFTYINYIPATYDCINENLGVYM